MTTKEVTDLLLTIRNYVSGSTQEEAMRQIDKRIADLVNSETKRTKKK